jgi:hypothetical protein
MRRLTVYFDEQRRPHLIVTDTTLVLFGNWISGTVDLVSVSEDGAIQTTGAFRLRLPSRRAAVSSSSL